LKTGERNDFKWHHRLVFDCTLPPLAQLRRDYNGLFLDEASTKGTEQKLHFFTLKTTKVALGSFL
jgi:hypothetical protein